ncbi:MAG: hypothetical protein OHK0056_16970 [Bacteriovoracaceae bacterium]
MGSVKNIVILFILMFAASAMAQELEIAVKDPEALKNYSKRTYQAMGRDLAEESPLFKQILDEFGTRYRTIADREIRIVEKGRNLAIIGDMNHIGIKYTKSFIDFSVDLRRDVAPDLFDDHRYLVTDFFIINIDAQKLLGNLRDEGIIDLSETQYGAFAGVSFKREYKYVHLADNFEQALGYNLDKLFFSFMNFRGLKFTELGPYEYLTKEDQLSASIGGMIAAPIYGNVSGAIGALAKYETVSKVEIQSLGPLDPKSPGERFRISMEKEKSLMVGVSARILADFMSIVRLTLLSYDFNYELEDSYKAYLSFKESDIPTLELNQKIHDEVRNLLVKQKADLNVLSPYLISEEKRKEERKTSKYALLLLSGVKEQQTSSIQITKDEKTRTFFRHNFSKVLAVEDLSSWLLNAFMKTHLDLGVFVKKIINETQNFRMEYRSEKNLLREKEDLLLEENDDVLSLNFTKDFYTYKTSGWLGKKPRQKMVKLLGDYSGFDPLIADAVEAESLVAPMKFSSTMSMTKGAIDYFNNLDVNRVYDLINEVCSQEKKTVWNYFRTLFGGCKNILQRSWDKYVIELKTDDFDHATYMSCASKVKNKIFASASKKRKLLEACMQISKAKSSDRVRRELPLWRLSDFMTKMYEKSKHKQDMYNFFGMNNVFFFGSLNALSTDGQNFQSYFREGNFKGTGLINNYLKDSGIRAPASITY